MPHDTSQCAVALPDPCVAHWSCHGLDQESSVKSLSSVTCKHSLYMIQLVHTSIWKLVYILVFESQQTEKSILV